MTRFIRGSVSDKVACIQLTITESHGKYHGTYSDSSLIFTEHQNSVVIKLTPTPDNFSAEIASYSCTGITAEYSPITSFDVGDDGQSAKITIQLYRNQLIDFGVFVNLKNTTTGVQQTIFCDPQASNDPIKYC